MATLLSARIKRIFKEVEELKTAGVRVDSVHAANAPLENPNKLFVLNQEGVTAIAEELSLTVETKKFNAAGWIEDSVIVDGIKIYTIYYPR